jgi:hypothetical protein
VHAGADACTAFVLPCAHSIEPLGGHVDMRIKRMIVGMRAAEWTRIVIGAHR